MILYHSQFPIHNFLEMIMSGFTVVWFIAFPTVAFGLLAVALLARLKANQEKAKAALVPVPIRK